MGALFKHRQRLLLSSLMLLTLLAGCSDQRNQPECGDVYNSRIDEHAFDVFDGGMALHRPVKRHAAIKNVEGMLVYSAVIDIATLGLIPLIAAACEQCEQHKA